MPVGLWLALIALLVALWLAYRRQRDRQASAAARTDRRVSTSTSTSTSTSDNRYHAVSIKPGSNACAAAKALAGERFLSSEAPDIPLPDCDAPACDCRFQHHEDRRSGKDRRSPFRADGMSAGTGSFGVERRDGRERRREDDD